MSWNQTQKEFQELISSTLLNKKDFAYETNFNADPLFWIQKFITGGFSIHLIYFCLNSIDLTKERVAIRYENGGISFQMMKLKIDIFRVS
jgi:predicted ABC-type ATPase